MVSTASEVPTIPYLSAMDLDLVWSLKFWGLVIWGLQGFGIYMFRELGRLEFRGFGAHTRTIQAGLGVYRVDGLGF